MTWILGAAIPFGYGALISDVRVTWPDGTKRDMLQKVYPVGPMMTAGFAGSVRIGFCLLADMQRAFDLPEGETWEPKEAAFRWRRRGRRLFSRASQEERALGSSVIVVGISHDLSGRAQCIRMRAPQFELEFAEPLKWASIGTGTMHQRAEDYTQNYPERFRSVHAYGEVNNPGGAAFSTATDVATDLERDPMEKVSPILQVATVWPDKHLINSLERAHHGPAWTSERLIDVPSTIAQSWSAFRAMAQAEGLDAAQAAT